MCYNVYNYCMFNLNVLPVGMTAHFFFSDEIQQTLTEAYCEQVLRDQKINSKITI